MWYKFSQNSLNIDLPDYVYAILKEINSAGGYALVVGGAVRDALLGKSPKDIDFEVYRVSYDDLTAILQKYGRADLVGKAFGVIKFVGPNGMDFDFSLPRTDSKAGVGHKDFDVTITSDISPEEAAKRRDFTMNAISYNPLTHEIIDPFNGREDIDKKILRHTSDAFGEDPLRVLRGMQFAARYGFDIAPETAELAQSIREEYQHLPKERVETEFKKLVTKGIEPGRALDFLYQTGWSENFPHIRDIKDVPQEPEYHPEGDVSAHTKYVMNAAARIADREKLSPEEREILIYAALAHDFAKAHTTETINKKGTDRITSHGHEKAGGPLAREFLQSIGVNRRTIAHVIPLVENHLQHIGLEHTPNPEAYVKKLAEKLYPSNIRMLALLIEADHSGRPPMPEEAPEQSVSLQEQAKNLGVYEGTHPDYIRGEDIVAYTNGKGGPFVGQILKEQRKLILDHVLTSKEQALQWLDRRMQSDAALLNGYDALDAGYKGRDIKTILDKAWEAQKQGLFADRQSALEWLSKNTTPDHILEH